MNQSPRDMVSMAYEVAKDKADSSRKVVSYITDLLKERFPEENIYPQKVRYWLRQLEESGLRDALDQGAMVLTIDIETAPTLAYIWRLFKENIPIQRIVREGYVLCTCAKWLGSAEVMSAAIPDYAGYSTDITNDRGVIEQTREWLDQADMIIAHNGNRFDVPVLNYGMFRHGLTPPSPYRKVDTCKASQKAFASPSNKLDWLLKMKGLEQKHSTSWDMWQGCMSGDPESWDKMVAYCKQDVSALEKLYIEMRPWIPNHPNLSVLTDCTEPQCTTCLSTNVSPSKPYSTNAMQYPGFVCNDCGTHLKGRKNISSKDKKAATLARSVN